MIPVTPFTLRFPHASSAALWDNPVPAGCGSGPILLV
jgi:hypothetical protein